MDLITRKDPVLPFISSNYCPKTSIIYIDWTTEVELDEDVIIKGFDFMLDAISAHKAQLVLNDNTNFVGYWDTKRFNEYSTNVWFPAIIEKNIKKFAHIMSLDMGGKLAAMRTRRRFNEVNELTKQKTDRSVDYLVFNKLEDGRNWLLKDLT